MTACIFCGGSPLTREHIWPRWMARRYFDVPHPVQSRDGRGTVVYRYKAKRIDQEGRVRGEGCNNGWIRLEEDNRDVLIALIEGTLSRSTRRSRTGWRRGQSRP